MSEGGTKYLPYEVNRYSCRVCLQNAETCNSFYDIVNWNGDNLELKELYLRVVKVEITDDDIKPIQICEICTGKLIGAFEFLLNAEKNEEFLNQYMTQAEDPIRLPPTPKDINFNLDVEEDEEENAMGTAHILDNEMQLKVFELKKSKSMDSNEFESHCGEQYEILDGFDFEMEKDADNAVEIITVPSEQTKNETKRQQQQQQHKEIEKIPNPRNQIGSRLNLNNKSGTNHRYNCPDCQRTFAKLQTFQRHVESAHTYAPREEIDDSKESNEPKINCPNCPRSFMHKNDLRRHMIAIHPEVREELDKAQAELEPNKLKRKYNRGLCPHCGKNFPIASLTIHIRRHLGVNPYKCEECSKAFPRKQDLTIHQRHHSGERPHKCLVCLKSFIRPNKLARHMRIHLGIRPYKCEECGKSFSQSNDLKIHLRRHSGEKPYSCTICSEAFISGTALRVHIRAKSHFEPNNSTNRNEPDPFVNCRVNTRPQDVNNLIKLEDSK